MFLICAGFRGFGRDKVDSAVRLDHTPPSGLLLDKGWKFHGGDSAGWSNTEYDDGGWQPFDPSVDIRHIPFFHGGNIGWFRLKMIVDSPLMDRSLGMLVAQVGASDIYLNGILIYKFGEPAASSQKERSYFLLNNKEEMLLNVQPGNYPVTFSNVAMYYSSPYVLNVNNYDSMVLLSSADTMTINNSTFTGSFTCPATLGNGIGVGEPIVAYKFYTEFLLTQYDSYEYPAGFVTSVSKGPVNDTVYLRNTGQGIYTGNVLKLYDAKIKTSVY